MKPEEQRVAIAEACGYLPDPTTKLWYGLGEGIIAGFKKDKLRIESLPDYLNDLNAMHEAEKLLKSEQHFTFQVELARVINTTTYPLNFALLHATATQRAEAFLRTLNLYTP